jgi:hypothetical protein
MSQIVHYALPEHLAARQTARRRERTVQIVGCLTALVCFLTAGLLVHPVNRIRKERQLVVDPESIAGLPPSIALLGKLATFRALAIDWAAIRAERMKEQGKDYEALQLHLTVCSLAPRFPKLWVYAAWNMAYNISVNQYSPEERWQWVQNGIKILRDRGIRYNPRSVTLYKELAWIYWHKIGDFLDDEHLNYKRALAVQVERVLGPPPIVTDDDEYLAWFRQVVDAPRDLPALLRADPEMRQLVEDLQGVGLKPDISVLEFVARHLRPEVQVLDMLEDRANVDPLLIRRLELITDNNRKDALDRLLAAVRSDILRNEFKFDLDWMYKLMAEEYGPLDWRNAFSHSLYWASYGDHVSKGIARVVDKADAMNTARFVFFSLQNLITRGHIVLYPSFDDPFSSYIELTPDTRYIPYLYDTYMRLGKEQFGDDPRFIEGTPGPNFMTGFVTNMEQWIHLLYFEGGERNMKMAENFFTWLRENNPHPTGETQERYLQTLDDFVMGEITPQLDTWRSSAAIVRQFTRRALKQYALGQPQQALRSMSLARLCYEYWMIPTRKDVGERRALQPPEIMLRDEIISYMQDGHIDALFRANTWNNLPLRQKQMAYDTLRPYFEKLCAEQTPPWSIRRAFPEPAGMDEFRKQDIEYRGQPRREDVDPGQRFRS